MVSDVYVDRVCSQSKEPGIDITFLVYQRRQQIRQEDTAGAGSMSLLARIKFEQARTDSEEHGLKARGLQVTQRLFRYSCVVFKLL